MPAPVAIDLAESVYSVSIFLSRGLLQLSSSPPPPTVPAPHRFTLPCGKEKPAISVQLSFQVCGLHLPLFSLCLMMPPFCLRSRCAQDVRLYAGHLPVWARSLYCQSVVRTIQANAAAMSSKRRGSVSITVWHTTLQDIPADPSFRENNLGEKCGQFSYDRAMP